MHLFKLTTCLVAVLALVLPCAASAAWPPTKCKHVKILDSSDTDQISWAHDGGPLSDNSRLMDATLKQREVLGEALDMMPEVLCNAVQKVAFVYRPPKKDKTTVVDAWTKSNDRQNLVYLNTWDDLYWNQNNVDRNPSYRASAIQRMIHETTHCAIRMIQSQQKAEPAGLLQQRPEESLWPASARKLAKDVIARNRIESGVLHEWQRMHDAFVAAGMATAYWGDDWPKKHAMTAEQITNAGFTSAYGGEQAIEDIAEMASWAIVRGTAENPEDAACRIMNRRSGSSISRNDAAIFTKLGFVRTLGFISEEHYKGCVGSLKIEAPGQGFYSYVDGNLTRSYAGNPHASAGRGSGDDEQWLLVNISAEGTASTTAGDFPAAISLQLNVTPPVDAITDPGKRADRLAIPVADFGYPRGVYHVGFRHSKLNRLTVTNRDDEKTIMDVGQGVALISRASSDGIEGSVAVQRIFNFSGGMLSAIAGDEPVKEPTKITFKYDPGDG